jgi:glutathione S-transferase
LRRIDGLTPASAKCSRPSLLTFSPMIDSELCRFILTRYEIPFQEEAHVFGWVSVLSLFRAGTIQIPVFFGEEGVRLVGPRALIDRFDKSCPSGRALLPTDPTLRAEVELDLDTFGDTLGDATRVLAYYYLLPHREIMIEPFTRGLPPLEASVVRKTYPFFAGLLQVLLQLTAARARDALTRIRAIFDKVDRRIASGQHFLVGSQLTLSDLALATSVSPLTLPKGYGSPIPPFEVMPPALQNIMTELRSHDAARFVERIYRDYRKQ